MSFFDRFRSSSRSWALEVEQLLSEPWAMEPAALSALAETLRGNSPLEARGKQTELVAMPAYVVRDGVAVVPVAGVMMKSVPWIFRAFGISAVSTLETEAALHAAANDPAVKSILLSVDSPGGSIAGVEELADTIYALRGKKPIRAHADDTMGSAAYWVASQADSITAGRSARVGSIGVYNVLYDASVRAANEGVKVHVVSTHPLKGIGAVGAPISEAQLADVQRVVDGAGALFRAAVTRGRGLNGEALDAVATGQCWFGEEAQRLGLVDGVARFEEAHTNIRSMSNNQTSNVTHANDSTSSHSRSNITTSNDSTSNERKPNVSDTSTAAPEGSGTLALEERKELDRLRALTAQREEADKLALAAKKNELIEAGLAAGRITPAARPHFERLAASVGDDVKMLADTIAQLPVVIRPQATGATPSREAGADAPTEEMRAIERAFGVPVAFQRAVAGKFDGRVGVAVTPDGFLANLEGEKVLDQQSNPIRLAKLPGVNAATEVH